MIPPESKPVSALPSVKARLLAFIAILLAGAAGAAIGASFVSVDCKHNCDTGIGIGGVVGGAVAAGGTSVVATLTLRAMGEWKHLTEEEIAGENEDEPDDPEP